MNRGERVVLRHYHLRGYRLLAANARAGRYELDLVVRRGRSIVVVEVKEKRGDAFGHPLEMIDEEKVRRVKAAALEWLSHRPELSSLEVSFEAAGVSGRHVERVPLT